MAPFESLGTIFYSHFVATMAISLATPAVDEKVCCFLFVCLFFVTFWNYEVRDNGNAMKQCYFQNNHGVIAYRKVCSCASTGWLKLKYPTGQNAIYRQPCEIFTPKFLDLYGRDPATILKYFLKIILVFFKVMAILIFNAIFSILQQLVIFIVKKH